MTPLVEAAKIVWPISSVHFGRELSVKLLLSFEMCETCLIGLLGRLK